MQMMRLWTLGLGLLLAMGLQGQNDGHRISFEIKGFAGEQVILAHYAADKQYVDDTLKRQGERYVTSGEKSYKPGVYILLCPPDNQYFQLLISEEEKEFSLSTSYAQMVQDMRIKGSKENQLFYDYLNFLNEQRGKADKLKAEKESAEAPRQAELEAEIEAISKKVAEYQAKDLAQHPNTLHAALVKANVTLELPDELTKEGADEVARYYYYKQHYFDNVDLGDDRIFRTPFVYERVMYYVEKMTVQHPDSIAASVDRVLGMMQAPDSDMWKFYLPHFLNTYAKSKIVGQDAVYVHIVEKYYAKGLSPWTDEETLQKILENAEALKPLLIGKKAPDFEVFTKDKQRTTLYAVDAPYTVIFFWDPGCGHCKKSMPFVKDFAKTYAAKGVRMFAVCTKSHKEEGECWTYAEENELFDWINYVDPYVRYKKLYDIKSTPQIYILDRDKVILSKRIGAEQLAEVMDQIMDIDSKKTSN